MTTRTRAWRRWQRERIRRRRAHYDTVRWAVELGDGRLIDQAVEHPACTCWQCRNKLRPSLYEQRLSLLGDVEADRQLQAETDRGEP